MHVRAIRVCEVIQKGLQSRQDSLDLKTLSFVKPHVATREKEIVLLAPQLTKAPHHVGSVAPDEDKLQVPSTG
jgi:hypothetical protein